MEIREVNDKKIWEGFALQCQEKTFLQSWSWGEFQKSLGSRIWRLAIVSDGGIVSLALVIKHAARRGTFLLVPHGPVMKQSNASDKKQVAETLLGALKELAKRERADFIRISPIWERSRENAGIFPELGFRLRPLHTHPESSWKLDIRPAEDDLLAHMRKTTRYLIRQAEKMEGLEIIQSFDAKDVDEFNRMHLEVVKHQRFVPFSLEYFRKEFQAFSQDHQIALFLAKYRGKCIAASYGVFWSGIAFYHHAALLPGYKKVPAAYLLQWTAIKEAKKRGCVSYDFWGYSNPVKYPNHPYSGPTIFKMGFGGSVHEYVKTQDYIVSPKYWISYIVEIARKIRRGL